MTAKKTVTVTKPFRDRDGKEHKAGDRFEVDEDYGKELIRDGSVKDALQDPSASQPIAEGGKGHASQLPADPPKAQPK